MVAPDQLKRLSLRKFTHLLLWFKKYILYERYRKYWIIFNIIDHQNNLLVFLLPSSCIFTRTKIKINNKLTFV